MPAWYTAAMRFLGPVLLLAACTDYKLGRTTRPDPAPEDSDVLAVETDVEDTDSDVPQGCEGVVIGPWPWFGSPTFATEADPTDLSGLPFWDPLAETATWAPVTLPDTTIPVDQDRAYRADFALDRVPWNVSLNLQSDDGIAVWVNGVEIGRWGGAWQEEGCVNENAECIVTTTVAPVDVTAHLVEGPNTIAARVSNPVMSAWFEILPVCVE